jgi:hypothetical protein
MKKGLDKKDLALLRAAFVRRGSKSERGFSDGQSRAGKRCLTVAVQCLCERNGRWMAGKRLTNNFRHLEIQEE